MMVRSRSSIFQSVKTSTRLTESSICFVVMLNNGDLQRYRLFHDRRLHSTRPCFRPHLQLVFGDEMKHT